MNSFVTRKQENNNLNQVITFPIPIESEGIKEIITTNTSKEEIINQAFSLHSQGNISEALKFYQRIISQGFNDPRVFSNYGDILKNLGKLREAEMITRKAIEIKPDFAGAHYNLANILKELGQLQEAEISIRKVIKIKPEFSNAYNTLGIILYTRGKSKEAEVTIHKAIKIKPNYAEAHNNLGIILTDLGKLKDAEETLYKAIQLKNNYVEAYLQLSLIKLLRGDYISGLEDYEYRIQQNTNFTPHANPKISRIDNECLDQRKKLLVVSEQGFGDTLLFMRYIPYLRNKGFDISFCPQMKLHSLIKASGIDQNPLTPEQANEISDGQWLPLLSLPKYLQINPKNPIISDPYIHSTKEFITKWKNILSTEKRPIVGINWQGNPEMEKTYQGRSIPLEIFSKLFENNEITMLSLQKGFGSEQLDHCSFKNEFVGCQAEIDSTWDFLENAAIIENCDLIITNDTSIAHLAGGMGKKVWLLLRDIPFWTWGLEGESTFWYPSMRLFRQKERHNWNEVMNRVSNAIKNEIFRNKPRK